MHTRCFKPIIVYSRRHDPCGSFPVPQCHLTEAAPLERAPHAESKRPAATSPGYREKPACDVSDFARNALWFSSRNPQEKQLLLPRAQILGMIVPPGSIEEATGNCPKLTSQM